MCAYVYDKFGIAVTLVFIALIPFKILSSIYTCICKIWQTNDDFEHLIYLVIFSM